MYEVTIGGILEKGDMIAVSTGHDFYIAIYLGMGRNTVQYYIPQYVIHNKERYDNLLEVNSEGEKKKPFSLKHIWKGYVRDPRESRIIKLNRNNFTDVEQIQEIEKAKEILKELGINVNY
jgi:hypothetical protein